MAVGEPDYVRAGFDLEKSTNRNKEGENHDVEKRKSESELGPFCTHLPSSLIRLISNAHVLVQRLQKKKVPLKFTEEIKPIFVGQANIYNFSLVFRPHKTLSMVSLYQNEAAEDLKIFFF